MSRKFEAMELQNNIDKAVKVMKNSHFLRVQQLFLRIRNPIRDHLQVPREVLLSQKRGSWCGVANGRSHVTTSKSQWPAFGQ